MKPKRSKTQRKKRRKPKIVSARKYLEIIEAEMYEQLRKRDRKMRVDYII